MNLDQLLRDSAPHHPEMRRQAERLRPELLARLSGQDALPRSHRHRWVAGMAAAAAAAAAYVVVSPGGPAVTPAYAVDQQADGDVVVNIQRLEDADGLEAALREHGIDAEVSFGDPVLELDGLPMADDDTIPVRVEIDRDCGMTGVPAVLTREGEGWQMLIPADSPIQDQRTILMTDETGTLDVVYWSPNEPAALCAVLHEE